MRRIAVVAVALVVVMYLAFLFTFQRSKRRFLREVVAGSEVVETARGPIEYALSGGEPVVLLVHGTPGGYDQSLVFSPHITEAGFGFLTVSRPGYLRTPLSVGRSPAAQADAIAALLDALALQRIAVMGASGGAPAAIELAKRHPSRLWSLVVLVGLMEPVEGSMDPPPVLERATNGLFGSGFLSWLMLTYAHRSPETTLLAEGAMANDESRHLILEDETKLARLFSMLRTGFPPDRRMDGWTNDVRQFGHLDLGDVGKIEAPTLVVHGTDDRNAPISGAEHFVAALPAAEFLRVPGGDHWMGISRPKAVWPAVVQFLGRHRPSVSDSAPRRATRH